MPRISRINRYPAAPATDHTAYGLTLPFTANEAQAFGDAVCLDADGEARLANADTIATAFAIGICADASVAMGATGEYLLHGVARDDSWAWTPRLPVYLSTSGTTGNTLTQTMPEGADDAVQIIGIATHADRIFVNPQLVIVEHA